MDFFHLVISDWYKKNMRDLPWRETNDPYKIWISEIMLQQTRVVQAIQYYNRFLIQFPTVYELATAKEDEVLKLWQGLGYYTRARNLHQAAKIVANDFSGVFPDDFYTIKNLPGIGHYTAAAIASIAFNKPVAAIDGNIYRLLSRYFGVFTPIDSTSGKKEFQELANSLVPENNAGNYNQAMMEFGALQCIPSNPDCEICPLIKTCYAAIHKTINELPVKSKKVKTVNRYFYYYIIEDSDFVLLQKRTGKDIWKNLYQFPLAESNIELSDEKILEIPFDFLKNENIIINSISESYKHILTHQIIYARFVYLTMEKIPLDCKGFLKIHKKDIFKFAVPRLLEAVVVKTGNR